MARPEAFNRTEILNQAMHVFWEKGYNGTSVQDLVDATGLNRSSLYNSFGSKYELYQDTLRLYEADSDVMFQKALLKADNPIEAIRKLLGLVIPQRKTDRESKGCYILSCKSEMGGVDAPLTNWLLKNQEKSINLFRELVIEGQNEGLINSSHNSEFLAYSLYNTLQGLRMTAILTPEARILQEIIDNTIENIK